MTSTLPISPAPSSFLTTLLVTLWRACLLFVSPYSQANLDYTDTWLYQISGILYPQLLTVVPEQWDLKMANSLIPFTSSLLATPHYCRHSLIPGNQAQPSPYPEDPCLLPSLPTQHRQSSGELAESPETKPHGTLEPTFTAPWSPALPSLISSTIFISLSTGQHLHMA